jgi:diguanylate cyclase (GGDEF)-like protein
MSIVESAASRILAPLSALLHRPLKLATGQTAQARHAFAVRDAGSRLSVVAEDGQPFGPDERQLLNEIFHVMQVADESDARFQELEQRMLLLQRENLDLVVRNRSLSETTTRDTLTGLYNRSYLVEKLDSEISRALRHNSPMAVLLLDIDHFKRVNDSYGHSAGDQVLQCVGKVLKESCRVYDVPGRYGGEEFCVVLPETRIGNTTIVAERIRERLAATSIPVSEGSVIVTASIGIAGVESGPAEGVLSPGALLERADRALYSAKHRGRNRVELWADDGSDQSAGH